MAPSVPSKSPTPDNNDKQKHTEVVRGESGLFFLFLTQPKKVTVYSRAGSIVRPQLCTAAQSYDQHAGALTKTVNTLISSCYKSGCHQYVFQVHSKSKLAEVLRQS